MRAREAVRVDLSVPGAAAASVRAAGSPSALAAGAPLALGSLGGRACRGGLRSRSARCAAEQQVASVPRSLGESERVRCSAASPRRRRPGAAPRGHQFGEEKSALGVAMIDGLIDGRSTAGHEVPRLCLAPVCCAHAISGSRRVRASCAPMSKDRS